MDTTHDVIGQSGERLKAGAAFLEELASQGEGSRFVGRTPISGTRGTMIAVKDWGAVTLRLRGMRIILTSTAD